jgi:hypothetical protein
VFLNQAVGSTCSVSASGPALVTVMAISRSSGPALAYVTSTIQYLSSLNAPVSTSSYSGWNLSRDRLTSIRSW